MPRFKLIPYRPTVILFAITVVVCSSLVVIASYFIGPSFWSNFASDGLATIIGLLLGIPAAILLGTHQQEETEADRRRKILRVLHSEIEFNADEIKRQNSSHIAVTTTGTLASSLRDEAWRAFSDGGELEWIRDPELLSRLSEAYYLFRVAKENCNTYFQLVVAHNRATTDTTSQFVEDLVNVSILAAIRYADELLQDDVFVGIRPPQRQPDSETE